MLDRAGGDAYRCMAEHGRVYTGCGHSARGYAVALECTRREGPTTLLVYETPFKLRMDNDGSVCLWPCLEVGSDETRWPNGTAVTLPREEIFDQDDDALTPGMFKVRIAVVELATGRRRPLAVGMFEFDMPTPAGADEVTSAPIPVLGPREHIKDVQVGLSVDFCTEDETMCSLYFRELRFPKATMTGVTDYLRVVFES